MFDVFPKLIWKRKRFVLYSWITGCFRPSNISRTHYVSAEKYHDRSIYLYKRQSKMQKEYPSQFLSTVTYPKVKLFEDTKCYVKDNANSSQHALFIPNTSFSIYLAGRGGVTKVMNSKRRIKKLSFRLITMS